MRILFRRGNPEFQLRPLVQSRRRSSCLRHLQRHSRGHHELPPLRPARGTAFPVPLPAIHQIPKGTAKYS